VVIQVNIHKCNRSNDPHDSFDEKYSIDLIDIYDSRIYNGIFLENLKLAKVVPLFKSGAR